MVGNGKGERGFSMLHEQQMARGLDSTGFAAAKHVAVQYLLKRTIQRIVERLPRCTARILRAGNVDQGKLGIIRCLTPAQSVAFSFGKPVWHSSCRTPFPVAGSPTRYDEWPFGKQLRMILIVVLP